MPVLSTPLIQPLLSFLETQGLSGPEQVSPSDPVSFLWQGASGADGKGTRQGEAGPGKS